MDVPYPPTPPTVPSDLTVPTPAYKRHVVAAVAALLGFLGLYLGLMYWFGHTAWVLVRTGLAGEVWAFFAAAPAVFLFAFMAKGLFFLRRQALDGEGEVKREDEPALFAFIDRLADEVGAPRPHRVFLSARVNAAVFYDVSFWNLVVPSKKNLELGLGLVNVLTMDELKAVLAHELGHFAQRSMAVGTWVYTGGRAVSAIVGNRDGFDKFLDVLSRIDLRVAWIGWILRLVVWSVRVLLETGFRLLTLVERALSREMEFQADLVAASVTGSDSLIHALKRLGPADDALDRAIGFSMAEAHGGRRVRDVFDIQGRMLGELRRVLDDPHLGEVPPSPAGGRGEQRIFSQEVAEAPRMWASHPPNHEREANAKRRYVASVTDRRSSWSLFRDPEATRRAWTDRLYGQLFAEAKDKPAVATEATRVELERLWRRARYETEYRGVYVGRSVVTDLATPRELYGPAPADLRAAAGDLYPESLVETLKAWKAAEQHAAQLKALRDGILTAPGGVIRYQGRDLPRRELAAVLEAVETERRALRSRLREHDQRVRSVHVAMAEQLGGGWAAYLRGCLAVVHYAEHTSVDLSDAAQVLNETFRVVVADGNVSEAEMKRLLDACHAEHKALVAIYGRAAEVELPPAALGYLRVKSWQGELAEELKLGPPTREGLANNWLQAADTWVRAADGALDRAGGACLDALVEAEAQVRAAFLAGTPLEAAPPPPKAPSVYTTLIPGEERARPKLGWWDRFQIADGVGHGALRLGASAMILAPAAWVTWGLGSAHVSVYNGLGVAVDVHLGDTRARVSPGGHARVSVPSDTPMTIRTKLVEGGTVVEEFTANADTPAADYVYNVAGAEAFAETWIAYGNISTPEPRKLGASRWFLADEDYVGQEPPTSIEAKHAERRSTLIGVSDYGVAATLEYAGEDAPAVARAHVRWDPAETGEFSEWVAVGKGLGLDLVADIDARIAAEGTRVELGRARQDLGGPDACAEDQAAAAAAPDDPDKLYLALRCRTGTTDAEWTAAQVRFPDHAWLRWATGWAAAEVRDWPRSAALLAAPPPATGSFGLYTRLRSMRMAGAELPMQLAVARLIEDGATHVRMLEVEADPETPIAVDDPNRTVLLRLAGHMQDYAALPDHDAQSRWAVACDPAARPEDLDAAWAAGPPRPDSFGYLCWLVRRAETGELKPEDVPPRASLSPDLDGLLADVLTAAPADLVGLVEARLVRPMDTRARADLLLVASTRLGAAAPEAWRAEARGALLPWERWTVR